MTIKSHIAVSATISLALIAIIACQQKTQAPKEQSKAVSEQKAKVEEVMNNFEQKAKAETEKLEAKVEKAAEEFKEQVEETVSGPNLLANADFSQGLKDWEKTTGCAVIKEDGKNILELTPYGKEQVRAYQIIDAVSGHVYKLSYKVKAENTGALAIFRDDVTGEESYLYTGPKDTWKAYSKEFKAVNTGKHRVFLSCYGKGKFYYSDAVLTDLGTQE